MKRTKMNNLKLSFTTAILSTLMATSALAGTWTHTYTDQNGESETFYSLWCYLKDDGTYANNEWIQDSDGTWYWVEDDYTLPVAAGISPDGYMYDDNGRYVSMEGRSFPTIEQASMIATGMTYEQVLAILGPEHIRSSNQIIFTNDGTTSYAVCVWFFGNNGKYRLEFLNGEVSDIYGYFY